MVSKDSLGKLSSIIFVGGAIGRLLQYFVYLIIARGLGAEVLGIFSFSLVLLNIGTTLGRAGLDQAVQKYVPIYRKSDREKLKGLVSFSILASFIIGVGVAIITSVILYVSQISSFSSDYEVYILLIAVPFMSVMMVGIAASKAFFKARYAVFAKDFVQSGLSVLFVALGAYVIGTSDSIMIGYALSIISGMVLIIYYLNKLGGISIRSISTINQRRLLHFSLPLTLVAVSNYLVNWTDVLMLGVLSPATAIGKYQAAFQTTALLGFVLFSVNSIFPALASSLYDANRYKRLNHFYGSISKWVGALTFLGYVYLVIFSEPILELFGAEFVEANTVLYFLGFAFVVQAIIGPANYLLTMSEFERFEVANTIAAALLNIVLNVVLISQYGILGAAIATTFSKIALSSVRIIEVYYYMSLYPIIHDYLKILPSIALSCFVLLSLHNLLQPSLITMVVSGTLALLTFIAAASLFGIDSKDKILINSLAESND